MGESTVLWVVGALLAGIIWGMRLEGRVNSHEREIKQLRDDVKSDVAEMKDDIKYIREHVDRLRVAR